MVWASISLLQLHCSTLTILFILLSPFSGSSYQSLGLKNKMRGQNVILFEKIFQEIHSPSKCLVWVKKCCHVWLDQNFDPSLLTNKLWLVFMGKKQKYSFFLKKKIFASFPCQSLLVSKDGLKFWSSQTWQHFLTQTKHFASECRIFVQP